MPRSYRVIDSDGHVLEPFTLWADYIEPAFRDRAPQLVVDANGKEQFCIENRIFKTPFGVAGLGGMGARDGSRSLEEVRNMRYSEGPKAAFDPHARIELLDSEGIDASVLYPSIGLLAGGIQDPALAA